VVEAVRYGAADAGITIEAAALGDGLCFAPLSQERFDLVTRADRLTQARLRRVIDAIDDRGFKRDVSHIGGYDTTLSGHSLTLEAP